MVQIMWYDFFINNTKLHNDRGILPMQIIYRSLHNLDMNRDAPIKKEIPEDFDPYMDAYMEFATSENNSLREYSLADSDRAVFRCISDIFTDVKKHGGVDYDSNTLDAQANLIAQKLLDIEKNVQDRIKHMTNVQKGSIVQALLFDDDERYKYVIAKVEHSEWIEGETLKKNFGFPGENKRVWKSAVIDLDMVDDSVIFSSIKAYINTKAIYWTSDFLEVQEKRTDAANTKAVLHTIDRVLKSIKEESLQDYYTLRNALVHELQSDQIINYHELISELLDNYQPASDAVNIQAIRKKLFDKDGFDTQFQTAPESIKESGKIKITVSSSIDVLVKKGLPDWREEFLVQEMKDGSTYLMIRCDNEDTLSAFPRVR